MERLEIGKTYSDVELYCMGFEQAGYMQDGMEIYEKGDIRFLAMPLDHNLLRVCNVYDRREGSSI